MAGRHGKKTDQLKPDSSNKKSLYRVLLIEDEEAHADLIRHSFSKYSATFHLTVATTLQDAQQLIVQEPFDLIIADLLLPNGKGIDIQPVDKDAITIPVIIMTSHGNEELAVEMFKAGAVDYIVKSQAAFKDLPRIAERAISDWENVIKRKQAEEALRESELNYRILIENARDVVLRLTPDGILTYCSPAVTAFGGYDATKEIGQHIRKYFADPVQFRQVLALMSELIKRRESGSVEFLYQPKDRLPFWVDVVGNPIVENDKVTAVQCIMRDITKRKQVEGELQKTVLFLTSMIEQSPAPMWISDDKGTLIKLNKACCDLLNITEDDVVGKYNVLRDNIVEEQGLLPLVQSLFEKGQGRRQVDGLPAPAEVAELVDALGSGSSGGFPVGVQIPASAPSD